MVWRCSPFLNESRSDKKRQRNVPESERSNHFALLKCVFAQIEFISRASLSAIFIYANSTLWNHQISLKIHINNYETVWNLAKFPVMFHAVYFSWVTKALWQGLKNSNTACKPQTTPKRIERTFSINTLHKWRRYLNSISVKNPLSGKIMKPMTLYTAEINFFKQTLKWPTVLHFRLAERPRTKVLFFSR